MRRLRLSRGLLPFTKTTHKNDHYDPLSLWAKSSPPSSHAPAASHHTPPDLRIRDATREDDAICSVSESLAHGLVTRLTTEIELVRKLLDSNTQLEGPKAKRAAAYRSTKAYLERAIPADLVVHRHSRGDQSGKDKDGRYLVTHWGMLYQAFDAAKPDIDRLELAFTAVEARHATLWSERMCVVTRHAIMRLFFRLRTTKQAEVLAELRDLGDSFFRFLLVLRRLTWEAELLVPSARGAFVIRRDRQGDSGFAVVTWMSDERMTDNMRRHDAVVRARSERGLVVNFPNAFSIISSPRLEAAGKDDQISARLLNRLCDQFFGESARLPAEWRFREREEIPTDPTAGMALLTRPAVAS